MAIFEYNALTPSGRLMKGSIEASSSEQAAETLREMQLTVNEIQKAAAKKSKTSVGRTEFLLFNQQLASITKAGIPLERGLRELADDVGSKSMRKLVNAIADELEAGSSIEEAIEKRKKHFPALYSRILKAGTQTGRLSEMLTSLNRHLETSQQTRRIIFEALCYPIVVLLLSAIIITGVCDLIIPAFSEILLDMSGGEAGLPSLTLFYFSIARNIIPFWAGVGIFVGAIILFFTGLSMNPAGRRFKETMFLKIPILGRVYHAGVLARFAEAMAMLVAGNCDMPTCLRLSSAASGSEKMKLECEILASQIEQGTDILDAGFTCRMIPMLFLYSVQLGMQRNELQDNLHSLGKMYAERTHIMQAKLQTILMPSMVILVGLMVGTMVLAMFLPMVKMVTVMT